MALVYDEYDERSAVHNPNPIIRIWKKILRYFNPYPRSTITFQFANVSWAGNFDGAVDPNPMCNHCSTQLSFMDKNILICDHCHKYNLKNAHEIEFIIDKKPVDYKTAFQAAQAYWKKSYKSFRESN